MYEFHGDKRYYFDMTHKVTVGHVLPFIKEQFPFPSDMRVLEIGCGEAGVLKAFTDLGYKCTGIELEESRLEFAREFMKDELEKGQIQFLNKDIYDVNPEVDLGTKFDLIILKDVIEHIPNQEKFMPQLHRFLNKGGVVFFHFHHGRCLTEGISRCFLVKWQAKCLITICCPVSYILLL